MEFKRITIMSGHYGSGKTNIAVNFALELKKQHSKVAIADIDIVNPYFRTKDSEELLNNNGIKLICSPYANSNVDIPALPQDMYSVVDDKELFSILDVGGDERGALALGRLSNDIKKEDYDMFFVVNKFRPLTNTVSQAIEVMKEIENACRLKFTKIINNSNLGRETTPDDVIGSLSFIEELSKKTNLPVLLTTVDISLYEKLKNQISSLYPLTMQKKI
jgi:cellulose biosynthesis protein BcsQ